MSLLNYYCGHESLCSWENIAYHPKQSLNGILFFGWLRHWLLGLYLCHNGLAPSGIQSHKFFQNLVVQFLSWLARCQLALSAEPQLPNSQSGCFVLRVLQTSWLQFSLQIKLNLSWRDYLWHMVTDYFFGKTRHSSDTFQSFILLSALSFFLHKP